MDGCDGWKVGVDLGFRDGRKSSADLGKKLVEGEKKKKEWGWGHHREGE